MLRQVLFAKIHRAVVTACNRDYVGSIVIDPSLLEATGLVVNEKVLVADCETGARFETYIFVGEHGSDYAIASASVVSAAAPIFILYVFMSERFAEGLTAGGIKG